MISSRDFGRIRADYRIVALRSIQRLLLVSMLALSCAGMLRAQWPAAPTAPSGPQPAPWPPPPSSPPPPSGPSSQPWPSVPVPSNPSWPAPPPMPPSAPGWPAVPGAMPSGGNAQASPFVSAARGPFLGIAYPAQGQPIPADRPVIVLRIAAADQGDPVDLASLRVLCDDVDCTAAFQVTASEGWGRLSGNAGSNPRGGDHRLRARLCSTRGLCTYIEATIPVQEMQGSARSGGVLRGLLRTLELIGETRRP